MTSAVYLNAIGRYNIQVKSLATVCSVLATINQATTWQRAINRCIHLCKRATAVKDNCSSVEEKRSHVSRISKYIAHSKFSESSASSTAVTVSLWPS